MTAQPSSAPPASCSSVRASRSWASPRTGEEAVRLMEELEPDVVLIDIDLGP